MCDCDKDITMPQSLELTGDYDLSNIERTRYLASKQPVPVLQQKSLVMPMPLTGVVVDQYGDPVMGAHVAVSDSEGAVTDVNGRFSFPNILPLTPLTISHLSHQDITVPAMNNMQIKLDPGIIELDEVVVTAHKNKPFPWKWVGLGVGTATLIGIIAAIKNKPVKATI